MYFSSIAVIGEAVYSWLARSLSNGKRRSHRPLWHRRRLQFLSHRFLVNRSLVAERTLDESATNVVTFFQFDQGYRCYRTGCEVCMSPAGISTLLFVSRTLLLWTPLLSRKISTLYVFPTRKPLLRRKNSKDQVILALSDYKKRYSSSSLAH